MKMIPKGFQKIQNGSKNRVFDEVPLIALELHIRDLYIVYEADDLVKDLILGLTQCA